ncbi:hypothetical protein [Rhizobium leguminosarum]|uniref:hypothetical protein n=1 Tax=Rhizobium leguminosarum TaxID=384 RepID=UPI001AE56D41|nr:hypothetical protein [Rhizobium leguminosarum]MBP2448368.1 hypothetical protein [Rhizobium leguminosarum]
MPRALINAHMQLCFKAILVLLAIGLRPAAGMQPCASQHELLAKAKVVVEARVKSLSIGPSGLLSNDRDFPTRMIRADLEIKRVIKGNFLGKEAIVYGTMYPPGPFTELTWMALFYGYDGHDTFEWELSRFEIGNGVGAFRANDCIYYKFPEWVIAPRQSITNPNQ